jgi:hypothetical protein
MAGARRRECSYRSGLRPSADPIFVQRLPRPCAGPGYSATWSRKRSHEGQSLSCGGWVTLFPPRNRSDLDAVKRLTNELCFRYAALTGPPLEHSIVARFDINLFPNHCSRFHTSQYTSRPGRRWHTFPAVALRPLRFLRNKTCSAFEVHVPSNVPRQAGRGGPRIGRESRTTEAM